MLQPVDILNNEEFKRRLNYVGSIATMMKRTLVLMQTQGFCTQENADSLCLSDDTASWLCGHIQECNFVSFRVHIPNFTRPNLFLEHFKFKEVYQHDYNNNDDNNDNSNDVGRRRFTYMNYFIFANLIAVKLVVYATNELFDMFNDGLPYFIDNFTELCYTHVRVRVRKHDAKLIYRSVYEHAIENSIATIPRDDKNTIV
ncbi:Late expression factor 12 [Lonomia obliqua multiple nucleopolyhedrovirus]|uniref:Late expression factor 12 n=1 Tax=Lonomia obliqua multiple nucleopolyhedrovirus TaxID=134394 RepID=A0A126FCE7_9ABAC|nr:Late expression factor 12 [Lonomia obliqua multiple nucleopolyhedrovirus]AKN81067.1 Late expression factor 12 [Lonomia obliqua multiple nucleopolyhedrovirus]